jgi:transcriptional antiterminator RfaH
VSRWVTLYTKPRMEHQVAEALLGRGVETYLPLTYEYSKHRRRKEPTPFFPCYLFAQIEPASPELMALPWTPGLRCLVRFGGRPAWMPDQVIQRIREHVIRLERSGFFDSDKFKAGDRVRITGGPLVGLEAIFDRGLSRGGRVRILLEFLGQLTACEVETDWLVKAS